MSILHSLDHYPGNPYIFLPTSYLFCDYFMENFILIEVFIFLSQI